MQPHKCTMIRARSRWEGCYSSLKLRWVGPRGRGGRVAGEFVLLGVGDSQRKGEKECGACELLGERYRLSNSISARPDSGSGSFIYTFKRPRVKPIKIN